MQYRYTICNTTEQTYGHDKMNNKKDSLNDTGENELLKITNIEEKGKRNDEWEQLNRITFFRHTGAYYIVNQSLLKLMFIRDRRNSSNYKFDVTLKLQYDKLSYDLTLYYSKRDIKANIMHERTVYQLMTLEAKIDLVAKVKKHFKIKDIDPHDLKIQAFIHDTANNLDTQYPIAVKIKYWKEKEKSGYMICSGIHFGYGKINSTSNFELFKVWLEANKRFGVGKIVMANNSIPNTPEYENLFKKHKDILEIKQIHSLPNLIKPRNTSLETSHVYFLRFASIHWKYALEYNLFKLIEYNECFIDNSDKYQYILIQDSDELLIPRVGNKFLHDSSIYDFIGNLKLNEINDRSALKQHLNLESSCEKPKITPMQSYIDNLKSLNSTEGTYYFQMDHHLDNMQVKDILNEFDAYFQSPKSKENPNSNNVHEIRVLNQSSVFGDYNYTILLESDKDVVYAQNLIKIYRILIEEFRKEHNNSLAEHFGFNQFDRFLYYNGNFTSLQEGKSLHHTDVSIEVGIHFSPRIKPGFNMKVDPLFGHMSHFRSKTNLNNRYPLIMNVRELKFDFNFLFCYYNDVLKSLSSLEIA